MATKISTVRAELARFVEHAGRARRGEHEDVLDPLLRPRLADECPDHAGPGTALIGVSPHTERMVGDGEHRVVARRVAVRPHRRAGEIAGELPGPQPDHLLVGAAVRAQQPAGEATVGAHLQPGRQGGVGAEVLGERRHVHLVGGGDEHDPMALRAVPRQSCRRVGTHPAGGDDAGEGASLVGDARPHGRPCRAARCRRRLGPVAVSVHTGGEQCARLLRQPDARAPLGRHRDG